MRVSASDKALHKRIGERLHDRRTGCGLFLTDVGKALDISFGQVSRYEKGATPLTPAMLVRLAKLYGCTVGEFFDGLVIR